jgi:uncharacterized lipoprotein YddW (UPF0748 family)
MTSMPYPHSLWIALSAFICFLPNSASAQNDPQGLPKLPRIAREYRGVWVATVANIDWPSKPGLPTDTQKEEVIRILDKIAELRMNVVILQVRTSCDALYESSLEPWSYFLTGEQGKPPAPYYDPLQFWIDETHRRGMELHAWFNPFRAKNTGQTYPECDAHISRTKPALVKRYGNDKTSYLWLDPGETEARAHSLAVFMDVVHRYDVDGIHIDDYFYPYPVDDIPFPDDPAWNAYLASGGKLARDDWRRDSMNEFIRILYAEIKKAKPHVKFGISPFGIWKPGYPESVAGFSQYDKLYADAKLWLNEGWCDYYTPQLYWSITAKKQSFPALLAWWSSENTQRRHLAPGLFTSRIGDKNRPYSPEQIENQVFLSHYTPGSHGSVHFSMKALMENREGISDRLAGNAYSDLALAPECPWIDSPALPAPTVRFEDHATESFIVTWDSTNKDAIRRWNIQALYDNTWKPTIVGRKESTLHVRPEQGITPRAVAVSSIDGSGTESPATVITRNK